jgi:hypothetical protein
MTDDLFGVAFFRHLALVDGRKDEEPSHAGTGATGRAAANMRYDVLGK